MKQLLFKMFIATTTLVLLTSCTQDEENGNFNSSETREQRLTNDLISLSDNLQSLYVDAMYSNVTRSGKQSSKMNEQAIKEMEKQILAFQQKYNICQDLDEKTIIKVAQMMSLSEDSITLLTLDDDAYLDYIHDIVSEEFFDIQCHFRRTGRIDLTEYEIINNNKLRLNEKLQLVILIPFVNYAESLQSSGITRSGTSSKKTASKEKTRQQILEEAKAQWNECIEDCLKNLAKNLMGCAFGTSITEGILKSLGYNNLTPGFVSYGLIESAHENENCMYECDKKYQEAIK